MKIFVMCEGPNELEVINILLDNEQLRFTRDDLLDMRAFHARQLTSPHFKPSLDAYHGDLTIYRFGDKLSDSLRIQKELTSAVISQEKFCTKPELEMLFIIAENKIAEFEKVKSKQKPKDFCKQNIVYKCRRYDNSTQFYEDYFQDRVNLLTSAIKEYHRIQRKHRSDERYLYDLLK